MQLQAKEWNFANVAVAFRMIDDAWRHNVAVPWSDGPRRIAAFVAEPTRQHSRALQPFLVQISDRQLEYLVSMGAVQRWHESGLYLPTSLLGDRYSEHFGLVIDPTAGIDPELLTVS